MRRLSDYATDAVLVLLGTLMFFFYPEPELLNENNTTRVEGFLAKSPTKELDEDSGDYISIKIYGHSDNYEFSSISLTDNIEKITDDLVQGDRIILYHEKNPTGISINSQFEKHRSYSICNAYVEGYGHIIEFDEFNMNRRVFATYMIPMMSIILIIMSFIRIKNIWDDDNNIMNSKYLNKQYNNSSVTKNLIVVKPHKRTYIKSKLLIPISLFVFGMILIVVFHGENNFNIQYVLIFSSIYLFSHIYLSYNKVFYVLDNEGIHKIDVTLMFKEEISTIKYNEIIEVEFIQEKSVVEKNIGSIKLFAGIFHDGNKVYYWIIGIENYQVISQIIKHKASNAKYIS